MNVERYLHSLTGARDQAAKLARLQAILREDAERLREKMPDQAEERLAQADSLTGQIARYRAQGVRQTRQALHLINRLPGEEERQVLRLVYLSRLRIVDAADVMGYSARQCYRVKRRALMHLDGLLE